MIADTMCSGVQWKHSALNLCQEDKKAKDLHDHNNKYL